MWYWWLFLSCQSKIHCFERMVLQGFKFFENLWESIFHCTFSIIICATMSLTTLIIFIMYAYSMICRSLCAPKGLSKIVFSIHETSKSLILLLTISWLSLVGWKIGIIILSPSTALISIPFEKSLAKELSPISGTCFISIMSQQLNNFKIFCLSTSFGRSTILFVPSNSIQILSSCLSFLWTFRAKVEQSFPKLCWNFSSSNQTTKSTIGFLHCLWQPVSIMYSDFISFSGVATQSS